ncbi:hypothetical protein GQ55_9G005100 [Panicum hallii var. hallii]|jgi:hypothetical protein|uniref:Uncharacterized protein n=2 Tax=Panicum hallii TaxID=206008 RepID=A0A2T7BY39_9POAL|nr:uncharacterized protein LOC112874404 [Panicum hallii]PAN43949.1 hypothetical protein PAHAL_9G005300 [Panicum hallii]PUZ36010.1 hypothetical protein GQ55_9G005100 [Panicum hallii var. hallii]
MASQRRRPCIQHQRGCVVGQSAWPDLPPELLERIVAVLVPLDRVAVRLVCASWRACVRESFSSDLPFEAPRLLLRRPGAGGGLAFFSLHHRKVLPFALPASVSTGRCCGHIGGWLAMALDADRSVVLCNLISGQSIAVPPPPVFPVSKLILSGPPTSPGWVAAVLGRAGTIALLQPAVSGSWMTIGVDEGVQHGGFRDMAFWSGRLCALGYDGAVLAFRGDLRARAAAVSLLREAEQPGGCWRLYLAESDGELLLVRKLYMVWLHRDAVDVQVEVLVLQSAGERKWGVMEETPGRAVFVGSVASAVVAVGLYPAAGLRESCVYLARREVEMLAPHAICEYSLADEEMRGVPIAGGHSVDVEPVWITPVV